MTTMEETLNETIVSRAVKRFKLKLKVPSIIIAGNSLNAAVPHDIDVYMGTHADCTPFTVSYINDLLEDASYAYEPICSSRNAYTVKIDGVVYQFCFYKKNSLEDLVQSFDYAHVQVGAELFFTGNNRPKVFYTKEYAKWLVSGESSYLSSGYPLSSMIRAYKYRDYGILTKFGMKESIVKALADMIQRGFENYDDFRDQLDAIDLQLVSEISIQCAKNLYRVCGERGLIKDYTKSWDDPTLFTENE